MGNVWIVYSLFKRGKVVDVEKVLDQVWLFGLLFWCNWAYYYFLFGLIYLQCKEMVFVNEMLIEVIEFGLEYFNDSVLACFNLVYIYYV